MWLCYRRLNLLGSLTSKMRAVKSKIYPLGFLWGLKESICLKQTGLVWCRLSLSNASYSYFCNISMKLPYSLAASQIKLNVAFSYPFKNYLSVTHWVQAPESVPRIQLWPTTPWTYLSHNSTKETTLKVAGVASCLLFVSLLSPHNGAPSQVPLVSSLHRGREWDPERITTIHIIRLWWSHNSNLSSLGPKPSLHLLGYVSHWKGKILNNWKKKESNVIEVLLGWWPLGEEIRRAQGKQIGMNQGL